MTTDVTGGGEAAAPKGIGSVETAFKVLSAVERAGRPVTLTDLSRVLDMAPSSVYRYLVSLVRTGLVGKSDATGRYDLGTALVRMGTEAVRRTNEVAVLTERAIELRDRTGHTVNVCTWGDDAATIIRWELGEHPLSTIPRTGTRLPLLTTSVGRVFLALLPDAVVRPVVDQELAVGGPGVPTAEEVGVIREDVQRTGISSMVGALIPQARTIAAGVAAPNQPLPVVLTVVLPGAAATEAELEATTRELRAQIAVAAGDLGVVDAPEPSW